VSGPAAYAAREAINRSPIGDFRRAIEEHAADFTAGKLSAAGRDVNQAEIGGTGAVAVLSLALEGVKKAATKGANVVRAFKARGELRKNLGITDKDYQAHHLIRLRQRARQKHRRSGAATAALFRTAAARALRRFGHERLRSAATGGRLAAIHSDRAGTRDV
jgi:hypothetical protein